MQVEKTPEGRTHEELQHLLRVRAHNSLLELLRQGRIGRERLQGVYIDDHGENLWGHAIRLPQSVGGGVRLVARTNFLAENFFRDLKHDERQRSGRKNLGQDLEHLHSEAALVRNLEHDDYVRIVCGSLDQLPIAFAKLDRLDHDKKLNGDSPIHQEEDLKTILQLSSASLSPADRRVIRTDEMNRRIEAVARIRSSGPRYRPSETSNPTGS